MKRFIEGEDRTQVTLLPECLDDYVAEDNPVRVIDVFIDELDLAGLGFEGVAPDGFRLWAPESLVPTSGSDQTTARFGVVNHPSASAPTSAPSGSPCNRSEVSSATLL